MVERLTQEEPWVILLCTTIKQEAIALDAFTRVFNEGARLS